MLVIFIILLIMPLVLVYLFFKFYFILLYNTVLVLPYINMNLPQVYMSSQSWIFHPPPSPYHLSGSYQCTSPNHPVSCIEPRLLRVPLPQKEIKSVNPKGNQPWLLLGRTDAVAEAEAPILWPPDWKSWLIGKYPVAGKDWEHEEKGMTED